MKISINEIDLILKNDRETIVDILTKIINGEQFEYEDINNLEESKDNKIKIEALRDVIELFQSEIKSDNEKYKNLRNLKLNSELEKNEITDKDYPNPETFYK